MEEIDYPQTYGMSESFIQKTKRTYWLMGVLIPLGMLLMAFILSRKANTQEDLTFLISLFVGVTIFMELEILLVSYLMLKKIKNNTLAVGANFIQRTTKIKESHIYFEQISKLTIKRDPKGTVAYINVVASNINIRLCGFEHLDEVATLLASEAKNAEIKESQYKLDYNNPILGAVVFFATLLICFFSQTNFSLPLSKIIIVIFGLWILFFKPISKAQGKRFRALEIICGVLMVLGCLAELFL